jgi:hypothetical protein
MVLIKFVISTICLVFSLLQDDTLSLIRWRVGLIVGGSLSSSVFKTFSRRIEPWSSFLTSENVKIQFALLVFQVKTPPPSVAFRSLYLFCSSSYCRFSVVYSTLSGGVSPSVWVSLSEILITCRKLFLFFRFSYEFLF